MSSQGFKFPPPPPPPPTNTYQQTPPQWTSGRGRGGPARGRGSFDRQPRGGPYAPRGGSFNSHTRGQHRDNSGNGRGRGGSFDSQPPHQGHKRRHDQAFDRSQPRGGVQSTAPPPVPSFGFQLPAASPQPAPSAKLAPVQRQTKQSLLGLTPSMEDNTSEAGDEDEEARLAAQAAANGEALEFTYRGQTASLNSAAEIAAWIAERRKRFPTKAKAEAAAEKAKLEADERAKRQKEFMEERQRRRDTANENRRGKRDGHQRPPRRPVAGPSEAEKLQKELAEARKRIAELEKQATAVQNATNQGDNDVDEEIEALMASSSDVGDPGGEGELHETEDETSSSGESSDNKEDSDEGDGAPVEESSKRQGPEKVPLPPRERKEPQVCRDFARRGRCPRGRHCNFKHEPPEVRNARPGTVQGKSLFQKLAEQEKEINDEFVLQHILYLGDNGYLKEPEEGRDASEQGT